MKNLFRWHRSGFFLLLILNVIQLPAKLAYAVERCFISESTESREIVRRKKNLFVAQKLLLQGGRAIQDKNYEDAYRIYLKLFSCVPEAPAAAALRKKARNKFAVAGNHYACWLIKNGRYSEAKEVAETILFYDAQYSPAIQLLSQLQKPHYFQITPNFASDQKKITHLLTEAEGFYKTGRFDLAQKRYEEILSIDPYHIAARQGEKRVHKGRDKYYQQAFQESRSRFLRNVQQSWERPAALLGDETTEISGNLNTSSSAAEEIRVQLKRILLPKVEFRDATVREVIDFLKQRARELDPTLASKGINIVLKLGGERSPLSVSSPVENTHENSPTAMRSPSFNPKIDLNLKNIPLYDVLRYVCELAGLKFKVESYAVCIVPLFESEDQFFTKEYRILPSFLPTKPLDAEGGLSLSSANERKKTWVRMGAQEYLQSQGVLFPKGATANYVPAGSRLIVRNTTDALNLIDSIVAAANGAVPLQVQIESKFVSISQNNLKELGFDWLLGPVSLPSGFALSGGGSLQTASSHYYPIVNRKTGLPIGGNPATSNLRGGNNSALTLNSINSLIAQNGYGDSNGSSLFGISGIFSQAQFQMVIRALSQTKGVDLVSAPKITTRSGQKATIKMVRAFPYPTEFQPPQIPQKGIVASNDVLANNAFVSQTVTPTTPTRFEVRNTGVTMEVEPVVGPDGYSIDLNLSPEIVEFEGFINYGVPILGVVNQAVTGIPASTILTQNNIHQPVFSTRKVTTSVTIWDGQTVVLGGFMREDIQKVADKVPFLGDIPWVGQLFRSYSEQKIKENLIIFVTARLIDTQGRPVRSGEERESPPSSTTMQEISPNYLL